MTKIECIERFIKTNITKRCKEGFRLCQMRFGGEGRGCALTACSKPLSDPKFAKLGDSVVSQMRVKFHLSEVEIWSFVHGYDEKNPSESYIGSKEYARLGRRVAKWARKAGYLQ